MPKTRRLYNTFTNEVSIVPVPHVRTQEGPTHVRCEGCRITLRSNADNITFLTRHGSPIFAMCSNCLILVTM